MVSAKSQKSGDNNRVAPLPVANAPCSEPLFRYFVEYQKIINLFVFLCDVSARVDVTKKFIEETLEKIDKAEAPPSLEDVEQKFEFGTGSHTKFLRENRHTLSRFLVTNSVDNFLCYLSDILAVVIQKRPEILHSSEQIRIEEVVRHQSMAKLIAYLTERKVHELSYMGLKDISKYLEDRLGVNLTPSDVDREMLSRFIEIRNIHVHNRGIINSIFISRLRNVPSTRLGTIYHVDFDEFTQLNNVAFSIARGLDKGISNKFGLRLKKFSSWQKDQKVNTKES